MKKTIKKPSSRILQSVYQSAKDLAEIGVIDSITMRKFESICSEKVHDFGPLQIKMLRLREKVSQPVFAWYINVKPTTVKKWETGENTPSGPALKLLNLIEKKGLEFLQ